MNDYHEKFSTTGRLSVTSKTPDEADSAHLRNEVSTIMMSVMPRVNIGAPQVLLILHRPVVYLYALSSGT